MLHVFDECAHEHYQRTQVVMKEDPEHSSVPTKRKLAINQRAGWLKITEKTKFVFVLIE